MCSSDLSSVMAFNVRLVFSTLLIIAETISAEAQSPSAPAKNDTASAISSEPSQTTATYGDWVLRCIRSGETQSAARTCEVSETLVVQGQKEPAAQIAIGSAKNGAALNLTVLLPTAISLAKPPSITASDANTRPFILTWRRCLPVGCFSDVSLTADMLKTLQTHVGPMKLVFMDAADREVSLPFSLRGLPQALDALSKETSKR